MKVAIYERKRSEISFVKEIELISIEDYRKQALVNRERLIFIVDNRIYNNEGLICLLYSQPRSLK